MVASVISLLLFYNVYGWRSTYRTISWVNVSLNSPLVSTLVTHPVCQNLSSDPILEDFIFTFETLKSFSKTFNGNSGLGQNTFHGQC